MVETQIVFRTGCDIPIEALLALYKAVGWHVYTAGEAQADLVQALRNSTYVVTAWEGDRLLGLARALSDDVSVCYLQDILVLPAFQGQGIGTRLAQTCIERFGHVRLHITLTDNDERQMRFYESLGYHNVCQLAGRPLNAFVRMRGMDAD